MRENPRRYDNLDNDNDNDNDRRGVPTLEGAAAQG